MTDKTEAINRLIESGYRAANENGVVMITVTSQAEWDSAKRAIKDIGYRASWGLFWDKKGTE